MTLDPSAMARALGGNVIDRNEIAAPGPNHSAKDRSLVVTLDDRAPDGFLVHSHAGDEWRICKAYVRQRLGLPKWQPANEKYRDAKRPYTERCDRVAVNARANDGPRTEDEVVRINRARKIWATALDPRGTIGQIYLEKHRNLILTDELAKELRFHPACPWRDENTGRTIYIPALIAPFCSLDDDAVSAVHRIALNADGSRRDRRMCGIVLRTAIKLGPVGKTLAIGEGVETCIAAMQLGFKPAWALGSVGAISFFPILANVKRLIILGEVGEASERAIRLCGTRWRAAGRHVQVVRPSVGSDLNDVVIHQANQKRAS